MKNLESVLKSRGIPLQLNIYRVKAMDFLEFGSGCEFDHKESSVPKN